MSTKLDASLENHTLEQKRNEHEVMKTRLFFYFLKLQNYVQNLVFIIQKFMSSYFSGTLCIVRLLDPLLILLAG